MPNKALTEQFLGKWVEAEILLRPLREQISPLMEVQRQVINSLAKSEIKPGFYRVHGVTLQIESSLFAQDPAGIKIKILEVTDLEKP